MGLDSLEIVLAVEREWGLEIPDAAAERMVTVGDMYWHVVEQLAERSRATGAPPPDPPAVWYRLVEIISRELGVEPSRVRAEARFIDDLGVS